MFKRLFIFIVLPFLLVACAGTPAENNRDRVAGIVSAYGVAVAAANGYAHRPLCPGESKATVQNVCAERAVVRDLQAADRVANKAVNQLTETVAANPSDPSIIGLISVASSAVSAFQAKVPK